MEFRLTYEGPLLSESRRSAERRVSGATNKQEIRKRFHGQLKRLWEITPFLARSNGPGPEPQHPGVRAAVVGRLTESAAQLANNFSMFGYRFVPLATSELSLFCSVDVLLLRPQAVGGVIRKSGDIDNGFKTLFDALTMPRNASQLGTYQTPGEGEDPFFCLLEDDSLITRATIESDTLLEPVGTTMNPTDARVIIKVKIWPSDWKASNAGFA